MAVNKRRDFYIDLIFIDQCSVLVVQHYYEAMYFGFLAYRPWVPNEDLCSAISVCCGFDIQTLKETSLL